VVLDPRGGNTVWFDGEGSVELADGKEKGDVGDSVLPKVQRVVQD
jgi:hypothetical protein